MKRIIISIIFIIAISCYTYAEQASELAFVNSKGGLVLREKPDKISKKITVIPYQQEIMVLEYSDNYETIDTIKAKWAKVKYSNYQGWVFSGYLKTINYSLDDLLKALKDNKRIIFDEGDECSGITYSEYAASIELSKGNIFKYELAGAGSVPVCPKSKAKLKCQSEGYNSTFTQIKTGPYSYNKSSIDVIINTKESVTEVADKQCCPGESKNIEKSKANESYEFKIIECYDNEHKIKRIGLQCDNFGGSKNIRWALRAIVD